MFKKVWGFVVAAAILMALTSTATSLLLREHGSVSESGSRQALLTGLPVLALAAVLLGMAVVIAKGAKSVVGVVAVVLAAGVLGLAWGGNWALDAKIAQHANWINEVCTLPQSTPALDEIRVELAALNHPDRALAGAGGVWISGCEVSVEVANVSGAVESYADQLAERNWGVARTRDGIHANRGNLRLSVEQTGDHVFALRVEQAP